MAHACSSSSSTVAVAALLSLLMQRIKQSSSTPARRPANRLGVPSALLDLRLLTIPRNHRHSLQSWLQTGV